MAYCDSDFEGVWREATHLLGMAFLLLNKIDQASDLDQAELKSWIEKLMRLEDECDKKNILTLIR